MSAGDGDAPLLDFAVPEELLREAIAGSGSSAAVADVALMPGTGDGKPPALLGILRTSGFAPLTFITAATLVTLLIDNGIGLLSPDIQRSFHLSDAGIGAVAFAAAASQIAWGLPIALLSDRGSRVRVSGWTMLSFAVVVPLMAIQRNVWPFALLAILAGIGHSVRNTAHLSYLTDLYPTEARARVMAWRSGADPIARTIGIAAVGAIASALGSWRWGLGLAAVLGVPVGLAVLRLREPPRGANESSHILQASGLDAGGDDGEGPRVLFGAAVQRLTRIRSIYYSLVAVAVLGFAGVGIPLFGSLYLEREWGLDAGERGRVYLFVGLSAFLAIPVAGFVGDRMFRRRPESLFLLGGGCLAAFGSIYAGSVYLPRLWMVVLGWFLAECTLAPLSTAIFQTVAAIAPPEMRSLAYGLYGVYGLVFGGFIGAVVLGAISDAHGVRFALALMAPVCVTGGALLAVGARYVRRDITLVIEDVLERYKEGQRRKAGGAIPALQVRNVDFFYGTQQVLFDVSLDVPEGEIAALLGTNGAGKSTLLRAVSGLEHPMRGTIRLFGQNSTYLEAEQILGLGVALLSGGRMTFPSLTVGENLRVAAHTMRKDGARSRAAIDDVYGTFPALAARRDQRAGTLSGGEQQMLALGRVLLTRPRLLLIDELTLGLAPKIVEELIAIVRRVNHAGTTVLLVEQSVNLALTLAGHSFFLERGEVRFDGPTSELLTRDDLLRPVFLTGAS